MTDAAIDKIIAGIPNDQMEEGYRQQKEALVKQLALNAAAYRMQESNKLLVGDEREIELSKVGASLVQLRASIDAIDARLNGASKALKG